MPRESIDSIEKLAMATQAEFNAVHDDLTSLRTEVRAGFSSLSEIAETVLNEVRQIRIADLERRVSHLERHVGIAQ